MKKIIIACFVALMISTVTINVANAAITENYTETQVVTGGTITSKATYYESGTLRWSNVFTHTLNSYTSVKSSSVSVTREYMTEYEYIIGGQLTKLDYNYVTTKMGTATFFYER